MTRWVAISIVGLLAGCAAAAGEAARPECPTSFQAEPVETPFSVPPMLADRREAVQLVADATAGVRVTPSTDRMMVWFLTTPSGGVDKTIAHSSSGDSLLDAAVLRAASQFRFSPAYQDTVPVCAWIRFAVPTGEI